MTPDFEQPECSDELLEGEPDLPATVNTHSATWILSDSLDVGDMLENCRLVAPLGYGSSGRAFLAQQPALADRWIVLKVTTNTHEEHLNLARLQHTHIMPLYWASMQPFGGLRVLAMPYLAKTTLSGLLKRLATEPIETWNGERVFAELHKDQEGLPVQIPAQEHLTQTLTKSTWVDFVLRMGQTLAEALAFAHRRNLLHLDVKPSNILITPDGQPILLDLDVARQPIPAGTASIPWFGGTPAYCSPEQRQAMEALSLGKPIPAPVDGRADVYSLGVVLFLALGGTLVENQVPDPTRLPKLNPAVDREVVDIIAHCLAEQPKDRYPNCSALAADLERQLHHLPLRGVRERLSDRWRKWRRRRPLALFMGVLFTSFCAAMTFAGLNHQQVNIERRGQAQAALLDGQELLRQGQYEAAVRRLSAGAKIASQTNGIEDTHEQLTQRLRNARRLQHAQELSDTIRLMRVEALEKRTPKRLQHVLEASGRTVWTKRGILTESPSDTAPSVAEKKIDGQLQELLVLWCDLQKRLALPTHERLVKAEVHKIIGEAEKQFGSCFAVKLAKDQHGIPRIKTPLEPKEPWEHCALGRNALARTDLALANHHFQKAIELCPLDSACNLHVGMFALRQKNYSDALQALSFCLGSDPLPEVFVLRSETYAALRQDDRAMRDVQQAIDRKPDLGYAYEQRGNVHKNLGMLNLANADFDKAKELNDLK